MSILLWLSTGLSTVAIILAVVGVRISLKALAESQARWLDSTTARTIDSLRTEVSDIEEKMQHLHKLYRRLLARTNKREKVAPVSEAPDAELPLARPVPGVDVEPNPFTEPEAWKRYKRIQMAQQRGR